MRTPCQEAPEAWVGNDLDLRAEAVRACQTCPALNACRQAVQDDPTLQFGVMAGIDYDGPKRKPGRPKDDKRAKVIESKPCDECGKTFTRQEGRSSKQWAAQRFCNRKCGGKATTRQEVAA